jgi:tetratricopeptide (TPR) repeat protein
MQSLFRRLTLASLAVALVSGLSASAYAQAQPPAAPKAAPFPTPSDPPPQAGEPQGGGKENGTGIPPADLADPTSPDDRAKLLDNLYAYLATADSADRANSIANAVERLWLWSGSDTIAVLMNRALVAANEKNYDLSLKLLDTVVELAPDYAEGWNRRAYVYYMQGDMERALGDLRRVLALEPNHFKALDGVASIMNGLGEKKAALEAYKRLLAVHPYWPGAKDAVDELKREVDGQGI